MKRSRTDTEPLNHYNWLEQNLPAFFTKLGIDTNIYPPGGLISAHGDKFYTYRDQFEAAGLQFHEGVAIGLLTHIRPWAQEVRETSHGWVPIEGWIIANKDKFLHLLKGPVASKPPRSR